MVSTGPVKGFSISCIRNIRYFVFVIQTAIYLHLRRQFKTIHYYRSAKTECDFLVKENEAIIMAVQACWEVNKDNLKKEIGGLKNAMAETGIESGVVVTYDQEDKLDGIFLIPAWKWFQNPVLFD